MYRFHINDTLLQSGNCTIVGRILGAKWKEALVDAKVEICSTKYNSHCDIKGMYSIKDVPPGTYDIKVTEIGFFDYTAKNIELPVNHIINIDFELAPVYTESNSVRIK